MICSYLLHGCDVIRIFKLCIEERGVSIHRGRQKTEKEYAIPKINMLCNLCCLKARLRLLCNKYQQHSSLNSVSQQLKLCNMFIFGMAYQRCRNFKRKSRFKEALTMHTGLNSIRRSRCRGHVPKPLQCL